MKGIWSELERGRILDKPVRAGLESAFGNKAKKALAAIDAGKIRRYLDFFVVEGWTASYVVDEEFCSCGDFMYRGRTCWHLLRVRIATITGRYERVERWYTETRKDEPGE
jgi:predicted nucleic acid-binding Zn finger protein